MTSSVASLRTSSTPKNATKQGSWSTLGFKPKHVRWLMNIWGPFVGARIHIERIADDFRFVRVRMKQSWYNGNYVGVHFGGSLYAMTDPFYMLMVLHNLNLDGKQYIVWDKSSVIDFKKPAKGYVYAEFSLSTEQIRDIKAQADALGKYEPQMTVDVLDARGVVVATAHKTLYIRRIQE
jgi:Domain of unknown function (DUF4442)